MFCLTTYKNLNLNWSYPVFYCILSLTVIIFFFTVGLQLNVLISHIFLKMCHTQKLDAAVNDICLPWTNTFYSICILFSWEYFTMSSSFFFAKQAFYSVLNNKSVILIILSGNDVIFFIFPQCCKRWCRTPKALW